MTLIEIATPFMGRKEKPGNAGFVDEWVEKELKAAGWQAPWAYCILAVKAWVMKSQPDNKKLHALFSPNVQDTFENLLKAGYKITMEPAPNAIVFWEFWDDGRLTTKGHAGLVKELTPAGFTSMEGNTDGPSGSRDGDGFYERARVIVRMPPKGKDALIVKGFIHL